MQIYRDFVRGIIRNYLIGSVTAVLLVGGTFIFPTLEIPDFELSVMLVIIIISLFVMMASEFYVLKKDLHKIKYAILKKPHPSEREIKLAYEQAHRFPYLTVRRILLPHFLVFLYQLVPFLFYVFT